MWEIRVLADLTLQWWVETGTVVVEGTWDPPLANECWMGPANGRSLVCGVINSALCKYLHSRLI